MNLVQGILATLPKLLEIPFDLSIELLYLFMDFFQAVVDFTFGTFLIDAYVCYLLLISVVAHLFLLLALIACAVFWSVYSRKQGTGSLDSILSDRKRQ